MRLGRHFKRRGREGQIVVRILKNVWPLFQPREEVPGSERRHRGQVEVEAPDEIVRDRDRDVELVGEVDKVSEVVHRGLDEALVHHLGTIRFNI